MKHLIFIVLAVFLAACKQDKCGDLMCPTVIIPPLTIQFKNASGSPITVKDFSAIIERTGKPTSVSSSNDNPINGYYMVASDADKNNLRENGDVITISATNPLSKQLKKTQFIIAGGECTCGISKKAGVVVLIFD